MTRRLWKATLAIIVMSVGILGGWVVVQASTSSHWTSGTGTHSSGSHAYNPSHLYVAVGASNSGDGADGISSGGRFHDVDDDDVCCVGPHGGDFALDIDTPNISGVGTY
jgi:hypothetical protein